jgi:hypothetical protein
MANIRTFDAATIRSVADGSATIAELDSLGFDNIFAIKADPEVVQRRTCEAGVRSIEDTERRVSYLMSTSNPVGRTGDVILTQGWDFSEFAKRGMPFLYDHNLDKKNYGLPLGRMDNLRFYEDEDGRKSRKPKMGYYSALMGDGVYTPYGVNDFNDLVYRMVDEGYMDGFSVGFRAMSSRKPNESERSEFAGMSERGGLTPYSVVHERTMLIEGSVTPVGMDPDATRIKRLKERVVTLSERGQASRSEAQHLLEILGIGDVRTVVPVSFGEGVFEPDVQPVEIEQEQEEQRAEPGELSVGDHVAWGSSGGRAHGVIKKVVRDGEIDVPDSSFTIKGTPDDPAALIALHDDNMEETGKMVGHKFSTLSKAKRSYENESSSADDDSGIESRIREIEGELAELADCAANMQGIAEEISGLRAIIEDIQCRTEITDRIRKLEVVLGVEDNTTGKSNGKSDLDAALGL